MDFIWLLIVFGAGLAIGWFFLPPPASVQRWWTETMGWKDRVP